MKRPNAEEDFHGTDRFLVQRRLGAGSYGVVYQALDRQSGAVVALKTLRYGNVEALFRLKREFRALADIAHPNLIAYHELLAHGEQWFFTMELIEGVNFLQYVRAERAGVAAPSDAPTLPADEAGDAATPGPAGRPDRIRAAVRQAVAGIQALHLAGQIHRDVKPSNLLVTPEGRLAVLDFGLVTDLDLTGSRHSLSIVGTPVYMSPEQGAARPVSAATDWYSLGVMLFEALTGRWPFSGGFIEMMWEKQHADAPNASDLVPGVPEDLNTLCRDLLRREPEARPGAEEILARLGAVQAATYEPSSLTASTSRTPPFLGRERHLASLRSAFEEAARGHAVVVRLHGPSGAGKTVLARRFLHEVRKSGGVVLSGRCYERESVPYKAVDSLVDALSQFLKRLPADRAAEIVPAGASALARLFPVLRRVDAIAAAEGLAAEVPDSQELRRLAFSALRELLDRIAARHRLVLFLDDLQWGDLDSAALLTEALRPPRPPSLLLIACYRSDGPGTSPFLTTFLAANPAEGSPEVRELVVGALEADEARELTLALLDGREPSSRAFAEQIARESGGNPLFLSELVRLGQAGVALSEGYAAIPDSAGGPTPRRRTLEEILGSRILDLPEAARRLLEILAVAGRPLRASLAERAAELPADDGSLALLFARHLVRARTDGAADEIVPYHDQIREAAVASLPAETLRSHHRRLAAVLEGATTTDPEALALHFQEAGNSQRAADYASVAASRASEALAFDRAARLYRLALELRPEGDGSARRALSGKLGDALSNAGQGSQAAQAYLDAVPGAPAAEALELRRRAAEQLLISGRLEEGLRTLQTVLDRVGLKLAASPRAALLSMLYRRLLVRLRGTRFRERAAAQIPHDLLMRIDICWSAAKGMSLSDPIRGNDFHSRQLLLALRAGEPYRVARALAMEAGYSAMGGVRTRHRTDRILASAAALADRIQNPHAVGFTMSVAGIAAGVEGRWKDAHALTLKAGAMLRERCRGVAWEIDNSNYYALLSLAFLGQFRELQDTLPRLLREAQDRSDLFAATNIRTRLSYLVLLAQDRPREAQEELQQAIEGWSPAGFFLQHWYELLGQVESSLYAGDIAGAWERLAARWPRLEGSLFLRVQSVRINSLHLRARTAIAAAASSPQDRGALCAIAQRDARGIEREATPWGNALGRLLRAGIATVRRDAEPAELLESAEREFRAAGMALHEAVACRRLGQVRGGAEGRRLVDAADDWMAGQQIRSPELLAAMLAPGVWPT